MEKNPLYYDSIFVSRKTLFNFLHVPWASELFLNILEMRLN